MGYSRIGADLPIEKIYWQIGEVAELLNCNASRIRFWCTTFGIQAHRTRRDFRSFTRNEVDMLFKIYNFREVEGFTIEGTKRQLKLLKNT